jgi:hypothetical protein
LEENGKTGVPILPSITPWKRTAQRGQEGLFSVFIRAPFQRRHPSDLKIQCEALSFSIFY